MSVSASVGTTRAVGGTLAGDASGPGRTYIPNDQNLNVASIASRRTGLIERLEDLVKASIAPKNHQEALFHHDNGRLAWGWRDYRDGRDCGGTSAPAAANQRACPEQSEPHPALATRREHALFRNAYADDGNNNNHRLQIVQATDPLGPYTYKGQLTTPGATGLSTRRRFSFRTGGSIWRGPGGRTASTGYRTSTSPGSPIPAWSATSTRSRSPGAPTASRSSEASRCH
jgi:hypothetical protein